MRITTWNINSVRLRLPQVERFLRETQPDVLCLQEIKCHPDQFPAKALAKAGYPHQAVNGQKAYHGVATISRHPLSDVQMDEYCEKGDARHVAATLPSGEQVHNFYVPAGGDVPDPQENEKFAHKLAFLEEMRARFSTSAYQTGQILVGDLNIAPQEHDVWSHKQLLKVVSHTPVEVQQLAAVKGAAQFVDVMRELVPADEKLFSWWSYRAKDWRASNRGRRLDHIWVTPDLKSRAVAAGRDGLMIHEDVRDWEKPSDHAPVTLDIAAD